MSYVYQGRVDCFLRNIVNFKTVVYLGKIGTEHTIGRVLIIIIIIVTIKLLLLLLILL